MMMDYRTPTSAKMAKPTPSYMNSTASSTVRVCETRKMIAILQPMKVLVKIPWKSGITTPKIPTSAVTVKLTPSHHVPTATFSVKIKKPEVVVEKRMIATLHSPVIQGTMHSKSSHLMEKKKGSMLALKVNSSAISMEKSVLMASSIEQSTSSQISSGDDFHAIKKQSIDALVGMPSKTHVEKNPVGKLTPSPLLNSPQKTWNRTTSFSAQVTPTPGTPLQPFRKRRTMAEASTGKPSGTKLGKNPVGRLTPSPLQNSGQKPLQRTTSFYAQLTPKPVTPLMAEAPREEKTTVSSVQSGFCQVDVHRKKYDNEKMFKTSTHHQMMSARHSSKNSFFTGNENKVNVMTSIRGKIRMKKTPSAANIISRKKLVGKGVLVPCRSKTSSLGRMYNSPSTGNHEKKPEPPDDFSDYQGALEKLHALLDTNPIDLALSESAKKDQVIYELRSTCAELEQELAIHRALNEIDRGKLESHTRIELEKLAFADEESKKKDAEISELKKICAQLRDELESLRVFSMGIFEERMVEGGQSLYYEESKRRSVLWESAQDGWSC